MLVTMAVQRIRISMVMTFVTKTDTYMNNWMVVMLVTMAAQMNRLSMVMIDNRNTVVLVTMAVHNTNTPIDTVMSVMMAVPRDRVSSVMNFLTKMNTNMNNPMNMVMVVTMAVQRDRIPMDDGKS